MRVEIWTDAAARARLDSADFRAQWDALYAACPWASVFQSTGYAGTWYDVYRSRFAPLLVGAASDDGSLRGLLLLAVGPDGELAAAGARQAEYQVWMARPEDGDAFIEAAFQRLAREYHGRTLALRYLPPETPLRWLANRDVARQCMLRPVRRGIMDLTQTDANAILRKKQNRNKLNRLERIGPVKYERLADPAAIDALLEEIIPFCDLRHGAMHDVLPFRGDPLKAPFHRALARVPGLLCVSVLRCGDTIASAEFDIENRGQLALAFGALAPGLMRCSPGRLHILFLARDVARDGYRLIDLTPGGGYKDVLATQFDEVHTLRVQLGARRRVASPVAEGAKRVAKAVLARVGGDPAALRERAVRLGDVLAAVGPGSRAAQALHVVRDGLWADREIQLFAIERPSTPRERPLRAERLADLVAFRQGGIGRLPRRAFLRKALALLERGARPFTRVDGDELTMLAWASVAPGELDGVEVDETIGRETAVVHDLAAIRSLDVAEEWETALRQLTAEAARLPHVAHVLVAVPRGRAALLDAVRRLDGTYVGSAFSRVRGTRARTWSTVRPLLSPEPVPDRRPVEVTS